jgi:hypothetical protein
LKFLLIFTLLIFLHSRLIKQYVKIITLASVKIKDAARYDSPENRETPHIFEIGAEGDGNSSDTDCS